ncbi:MAG: DUF2520 domain-containing protein [Gammaproteobacteria bacterium]|jgi:predicted short-subunit dehydrogenase-like oxidoreductase (DUF2520 family)|nr:DUF2520 domain-containing protein [Gammaproteobacteria bacterium]
MDNKLQYGVIGNGRLARHLVHWFGSKGLRVLNWSRAAAGRVASVEAYLASADVILLAISDDAIDDFIVMHPDLQAAALVHCSGTLVSEHAVGVHLLQTFGDVLMTSADYDRIPFIVEADAAAILELFPAFPNPVARIQKSDKPYYHALCVLACSGTQMLWQKIQTGFESCGLDPKLAEPLLRQSARAVLADPSLIVTGPFSRGDTKTITAHLSALENDPYLSVYRAFEALHRPGH